jgi:hypothetical protein
MVEFIVFIGVLIVGALIKNAGNRKADKSNPSPRVQRLIERMQAQQSGAQPTQLQGQYTQPAGQGQGNTSPGSQGQGTGPAPTAQSQPPGQFQPGQYPPPPPIVWQPPAQVPSHRPPQNNLPTPKGEFEQRIRELMASGNEVTAVRLICEERDMGIIEAQKYARGLVAPPGSPKGSQNTQAAQNNQEGPESAPRAEPAEQETRYVGSAAFAESVFDTDRDENVWASGWVDKPEPDDRTDMDELWQTVRNAGRPPQPKG